MIKAMTSMDLRVLGLSQVQAGSERWYPERTPSPFILPSMCGDIIIDLVQSKAKQIKLGE
jgi:hypothetical protein